jgi:hypothetical protein
MTFEWSEEIQEFGEEPPLEIIDPSSLMPLSATSQPFYPLKDTYLAI